MSFDAVATTALERTCLLAAFFFCAAGCRSAMIFRRVLLAQCIASNTRPAKKPTRTVDDTGRKVDRDPTLTLMGCKFTKQELEEINPDVSLDTACMFEENIFPISRCPSPELTPNRLKPRKGSLARVCTECLDENIVLSPHILIQEPREDSPSYWNDQWKTPLFSNTRHRSRCGTKRVKFSNTVEISDIKGRKSLTFLAVGDDHPSARSLATLQTLKQIDPTPKVDPALREPLRSPRLPRDNKRVHVEELVLEPASPSPCVLSPQFSHNPPAREISPNEDSNCVSLSDFLSKSVAPTLVKASDISEQSDHCRKLIVPLLTESSEDSTEGSNPSCADTMTDSSLSSVQSSRSITSPLQFSQRFPLYKISTHLHGLIDQVSSAGCPCNVWIWRIDTVFLAAKQQPIVLFPPPSFLVPFLCSRTFKKFRTLALCLCLCLRRDEVEYSSALPCKADPLDERSINRGTTFTLGGQSWVIALSQIRWVLLSSNLLPIYEKLKSRPQITQVSQVILDIRNEDHSHTVVVIVPYSFISKLN
eukprot:g37696.t1